MKGPKARIIDCTGTGEVWRRYRHAKWFEIPSIIQLVHFICGYIRYHIQYPSARLWIDRASGALLVIEIKHEGSSWLINLCRNKMERIQ